MHMNSRFNILQASGNGNPNFVVIDGRRTDAGHRALGARIISGEMSRADAITFADGLQAKYQEGFDTALNDVGFSGNPSDLNSKQREAWNAGYEDGREKYQSLSATAN